MKIKDTINFFRTLLKLSDGNIRKLKLQIFDGKNLTPYGVTEVTYDITQATPVLFLGIVAHSVNNGRARREAQLSRSSRSYHASFKCGTVHEYLVDMQITENQL